MSLVAIDYLILWTIARYAWHEENPILFQFWLTITWNQVLLKVSNTICRWSWRFKQVNLRQYSVNNLHWLRGLFNDGTLNRKKKLWSWLPCWVSKKMLTFDIDLFCFFPSYYSIRPIHHGPKWEGLALGTE